MKNKTSKIVSALYFLCIVTCVLLSAHLVSDVAARFKTEVSGSDSARVAKFNVTVAESSSVAVSFGELVPGKTATWTFTVTSNSETAINLSARLEGTTNLPLTYSISGGGMTGGVTLPVSDTFTNFESNISYGAFTKTYTLTATWQSGVNYSDYYDQIDALRLTIKAEQAN